jgi:hypothetical protein
MDPRPWPSGFSEYLFYVSEGVRYSPRVVLLFFYYNDVLYNDRDHFATDPRAWALTRILYGVDETAWDRGAVCRRLISVGAARGFRVLDLTEPLRREVHWWRGPYFDDDGHWNALGHAVAARAVGDFLERSGWLSAN